MGGGVELGVVTEATQVLEVLLETTKDENSELIVIIVWLSCNTIVTGNFGGSFNLAMWRI